MTGPKVDILLAVFNGEEYVRAQIQSVLQQDYTNWRLIVSDDCSTDHSLEYLERLAYSDSRICLVDTGKKYGNAKDHFLSLLQFSASELVMFCDQDDVWHKDKLSSFVNWYLAKGKSSTPTLVFSDMRVVSDDLKVIHASFMKSSHLNPKLINTNNLLAINCVPGCSLMANRPLVDLVNRTQDTKGIVMHDAWCGLIASIFGEIIYLDKQYVDYRQHSSNSVGAKGYAKSIINGLISSNRHSVLAGTIEQAHALLREYGDDIPYEIRRVIQEYASLSDYKLMKKAIVMSRFRFWKPGIARKIDQLLHL